jgi:hypothetical protein
MTKGKASAALPPYTERISGNGAIERKVRVTHGAYRGRTLTFMKHSDDRYTVFGLSPLPYQGVAIERRKHEIGALQYDTGAMLTLREEDRWLAHEFSSNSYYGVLALGPTPEEAYQKLFHRFGY